MGSAVVFFSAANGKFGVGSPVLCATPAHSPATGWTLLFPQEQTHRSSQPQDRFAVFRCDC